MLLMLLWVLVVSGVGGGLLVFTCRTVAPAKFEVGDLCGTKYLLDTLDLAISSLL